MRQQLFFVALTGVLCVLRVPGVERRGRSHHHPAIVAIAGRMHIVAEQAREFRVVVCEDCVEEGCLAA